MCGGRAGEGPPTDAGVSSGGDSAAATDAPWDDIKRVPNCGQVAVVGGGSVYVGAWVFDVSTSTFGPDPGCDAQHPGNKRLTVATFWMMAEPATNDCYSECVKEGACAAPTHDIADPDPRPWTDVERAEQPVYVDHDAADTFCKWMGGHLPSLAQLLRATQGDAQKPGVGALTDAAIQCFLHPNPSSQVCGQIASMDLANPNNGLYPVGRVLEDTGPYYHRDLFGEGWEWTRTGADFTDPQFCSLADGAPDPVTFAGGTQVIDVQWATMVQAALVASKDGGTNPPQIWPGDVNPTTVGYQNIFRCAFDSVMGVK